MIDISKFIFLDKPFAIRGEEKASVGVSPTYDLKFFDFKIPDTYSLFIESIKFGFKGGEILYVSEGVSIQNVMFDLTIGGSSVLTPPVEIIKGQPIGLFPSYSNDNFVVVGNPATQVVGILKGLNTNIGTTLNTAYMEISGHFGVPYIKDANYFSPEVMKLTETKKCSGGNGSCILT